MSLCLLKEICRCTGVSKGKRFSRVVKRHGFGGVGQATHGQHNRLRAPGSVGLLLIHLEYSNAYGWKNGRRKCKRSKP
jgi:hypothetical protein